MDTVLVFYTSERLNMGFLFFTYGKTPAEQILSGLPYRR
jgi:hypothetical protein